MRRPSPPWLLRACSRASNLIPLSPNGGEGRVRGRGSPAMPLSEADRRAKLQELHDLAQGSEEFEGGITFEDDMEALVVGDWAFFAIDEIGDLALSFPLDAHPLAVARLTRFLVQHEVPFVLTESFTVNEDDEIVFESDTGADLPDK